ncbi:MAPEG family protein [Sneathiella chinensis]|uniref:Membrane protein n=1 Tax=Sneathiella chinensis TaxID=349750 RepID=A0ABQ5U2K0_9PROT|nr:MAPEG family protein [Sneathiella chinensis]GLQ05885.1 membrane protein [Sneathiella chinensis]
MTNTLSPEIYWLVLTTFLTVLMWVPYILNRVMELGLLKAMQTPEPGRTPEADWAYRNERAHKNAIENLVIFAPLILAIAITGNASPLTAMAAQVYFWARLAHFAIYVAGIPVLRTLAFAVGFGAEVVLALVLLGVI